MDDAASLVWTDFTNLLRENTLLSWALALVLSVILTGLIKICLNAIRDRLKRLAGTTRGEWDGLIVSLLSQVRVWALFAWIAYPLLRALGPHESILHSARIVVMVVTLLQAAFVGNAAIRFWHHAYVVRKVKQDASSAAVLNLLYVGLQTAFFSLLLLTGLSNLGIDIGALLAGLGVGGIAVALAAQNILGDLLASLSIVLDKPFVVGDFVVVGQEMGTVEYIGVKTTRLRSLSGEQLVLSNKDMLESRIRNYKRMWERRVVQKFGVSYETTADQLEAIPKWVTEMIAQYPDLRLDRVHFFNYGTTSLDFELVFYVRSPEYNVYMDLQQKLLLDIRRRFAQEKIAFALPVQRLYIEREAGGSAPLAPKPSLGAHDFR